MRKITVKAFSTSANLGPGYDILALAHNAFSDELTMETNTNSPYGTIRIIANGVPLEVEKNSAGLSLVKLFHEYGIMESVTIRIKKRVPIGAGLGGSGCSSASSVVAANELFDLGISRDDQIRFAMEGEVASSGTAHPDNVAASIYGKLVSVNSLNPPRARNINIGMDLKILSIIPEIHISGKTGVARSLVPGQITMESHVHNTRNLSTLIAGFVSGERELIREGMNDSIVEPSRISMFPYYTQLKENAIANNAVGVCVSGAGPTILILYDDETNMEVIERGTRNIMNAYGLNYRTVHSVPGEGINIERSE
ncbi:MAG: homoserine kinase [Candidatus Thermoplasmatota archaeon]|nr:homoserine kinase [Candidatus Thermoplasmatota archaeon]